MCRSGILRKVLGVIVLVSVAGCATAINYSDPAGPIVTGPQAITPRESDVLRIVTFNIEFGRHLDRALDLLTRTGPLKDADVLLLQEMDGPGTQWLAQALGVNYVYVPSAVHPSTKKDLGVAILSPWSIEDPRKILLPHPHRFRKMQRSAVGAIVRTPHGPLRVFSVHFETMWGATPNARRDQARTIAAEAGQGTQPVVIAGDFNDTAGPRELERLGFTWLTRDVHNTRGSFDFDHIVVRGLCARGDPAVAKAPDPTDASDHLPVWATVGDCAESSTIISDRNVWSRRWSSKIVVSASSQIRLRSPQKP